MVRLGIGQRGISRVVGVAGEEVEEVVAGFAQFRLTGLQCPSDAGIGHKRRRVERHTIDGLLHRREAALPLDKLDFSCRVR